MQSLSEYLADGFPFSLCLAVDEWHILNKDKKVIAKFYNRYLADMLLSTITKLSEKIRSQRQDQKENIILP